MLLDKDTVLLLLDKGDSNYDSNLIALNTLPDDALFNVVIEDTVTAEYYDEEKGEMFYFVLDYSYISSNDIVYEAEQKELDSEMQVSLNNDFKKVQPASGFVLKLIFLSVLTLFVAILLTTILYGGVV